MKSRAYAKTFYFVLLFCCAVEPVFAVDDSIGELVRGFRTSAETVSGKMVGYGGSLLAVLAATQIAWNAIQLLMKGEFGLESAIGIALKPIIPLCMYAAFIVKAPEWIPKILEGWMGLGSSVSGVSVLNPGQMFMFGIDLAGNLSEVMKKTVGVDGYLAILKNPYASLQIFFLQLLLVLVFLILAIQIALALIKGYLWLALAPMLLGFGGLKNTQDIALNTIKNAISIGVVILVTYVILGIALGIQPTWHSLIETLTAEYLNETVWMVIGSAALIALAAWQVPKIANDFINGSISGGASEAAGMAVTAASAGVAAAAGTAAAGGALLGGTQAGTANLAALAGMASQAFGDARDHGKSGFDAASHAFGSTLSAGGSMLYNEMATGISKAADWATDGASNTVPGRIASAIEAGRGGSLSAGPSPDASSGTSSGGGPISPLDPRHTAMTSGGAAAGSAAATGGGTASGGSPLGGASNSPRDLAANSYRTDPGMGEGLGDTGGTPQSSKASNETPTTKPADDDLVLDLSKLGTYEPEASPSSEAGMPSDPGDATGANLSAPNSNDAGDKPSLASRLSSLSHQIAATSDYLPESGDAAVSVNANLHGGTDS